MSHAIRMLIGCVLPFLLLFVLPLIGLGEGLTLFVVVVLMFGCHLLMIRGHGHKHGEDHENGPDSE